MPTGLHVDNATVRALIEHIEKKIWPRGNRAATIGSLRDELAEATMTEAWDDLQSASGSMLADYNTPYS